ncbi:MAG TPA: hypothetical protein VEX37_15015, partial [Thermomicrobiales bacterium]|nr:hypothetical protein [Thermomicrobiales bacterium]
MNVRELVQRAIANHEALPPVPFSVDMPDETAYLATPDRLAYALGWIVAGAIVKARFADSGIDVLPVFSPEHGWDRFLITRKTTSDVFKQESANRFGMIMLSGEDAPVITRASGESRLALGSLLREDPERAIAEVVRLFPARPLPKPDLGKSWKGRQEHYPRLYASVVETIVDYPGTIAAREVFVDDQPVDGKYHPLYLHGAAVHPALVYDWFLVQHGERATFFRIHGGQSIYETDRGGWSTVKKQLTKEDDAGIRARLLAWLRLEGQP